jgi:lysophospholipase L1-like esterase
MRGSSGLVFTKMDKTILRDHYKALNVKLIILQFGGNVVPHITNDYGYYERLFHSQLVRIKQMLPDVAIIVIGVADMSMKKRDRYVSYPNIEKIRDAMKKATFDAGCIYWDMYEAMGGKNSMPSWVFANPPLASKDFVHFNTRGARIIAHMFYNSLMYEYNVYKKSSSVKNEN